MKNTISVALLVHIVVWFLPRVLTASTPTANDKDKIAPKQLTVKRLSNPPKIDGILTDDAWTNASVQKADNFILFEPNPGKPPHQQTEVLVLYDDDALYIGAHLYDSHPDSILTQLSQRDNTGNADWFGVIIDAYQDGLNGLGFLVSATGVQTDIKYTILGEESTWNAVWQSEVSLNKHGWTVEMRIPFSALRFANAEKQTWNINFLRQVRRSRQLSVWNEVRPEISGFLNQSGKLTGLDGVKAPVRLFFYPYISGNLDHYYKPEADNELLKGFNAGMDIKYGINDAFTLDMTLVPDFGQVQSDNQVLNLSPFEVRFNENRQFFTEGTELFGKADLFYSRRIGGTPSGFWEVQNQLQEGETIQANPSVVQLLNSTKISGRTTGGLGIGLLNSVTAPAFAEIKNTENQTRRIQTEPLTNYNIFVLDQNFKNNSYLTLINTNVYRGGTATDANVTGTEFRFADKQNTYAINGSGAISQKYHNNFTNPNIGYRYNIQGGKISGNTQLTAWNSVISNTYDHNDLGFLRFNNIMNFGAQARYNIYKPFGRFLNLYTSARVEYSRIYKPNAFQNFSLSTDVWTTTKKQLSLGVWSYHEPITTYDYFEPRVQGRYYTFPTNHQAGFWLSSNYDKILAIDANLNYRVFNDQNRHTYNFGISPILRASNKLRFRLDFSYTNQLQDVGFVNFSDNNKSDIIFGRRDVQTIENVFSTNYIFTNRMGITFRLRHYFSEADYAQYYLLTSDGELSNADYSGSNPDGSSKHDANFNAFNIDCVYTWQFAPGSEMSVVWKNAIYRFTRTTGDTYFNNFGNTLASDQNNNLSIKILYFLDYLSLKRRRQA